MKKYITKFDVANTVRMKREKKDLSVVIVEGGTDVRFYYKFFDNSRCQIEPGYGKANTLGAISELENDDIVGVLAIIDADYLHLENKEIGSEDVFLTDTHDVETMIIKSKALDDFIYENANLEKVNDLLKTKNKNDLRDILINCTIYVDYIKWYNLKKNFSLKFKGLKFDKFITDNLSFDKDSFFKELVRNSGNFQTPIENVKKEVENFKSNDHDPWQVCTGHHLTEVLYIGLNKKFGYNSSYIANDVRQVESSLRMCYESRYFAETKLFKLIKKWEKDNSNYIVLDRDKFSLE